MNDRIANLERLQRLRADGAITDDEFEREKASLLAGEASTAASSPLKGKGVALGLGAAVIGAIALYTLWPSSGEKSGTDATENSVSADPLATLPPEDRLKLAQAAAFPKGLSGQTEDGSRIVYGPGTLIDAPFGPVLVNEGRVPDASHAESGSIAIHYLAADGKSYRVAKAFPKAIESGSFGQMSAMGVSDKFSDLPVVYAEGGGMWQGYSCAWTDLAELRPDGPTVVAHFQNAYDDSGASDNPQSIEGKIANIVKGQSFDVKFTGSRNFTAHYVRQGQDYKLEGGEKNALEGC